MEILDESMKKSACQPVCFLADIIQIPANIKCLKMKTKNNMPKALEYSDIYKEIYV